MSKGYVDLEEMLEVGEREREREREKERKRGREREREREREKKRERERYIKRYYLVQNFFGGNLRRAL
jgi:hypothetical protein